MLKNKKQKCSSNISPILLNRITLLLVSSPKVTSLTYTYIYAFQISETYSSFSNTLKKEWGYANKHNNTCILLTTCFYYIIKALRCFWINYWSIKTTPATFNIICCMYLTHMKQYKDGKHQLYNACSPLK